MATADSAITQGKPTQNFFFLVSKTNHKSTSIDVMRKKLYTNSGKQLDLVDQSYPSLAEFYRLLHNFTHITAHAFTFNNLPIDSYHCNVVTLYNIIIKSYRIDLAAELRMSILGCVGICNATKVIYASFAAISIHLC